MVKVYFYKEIKNYIKSLIVRENLEADDQLPSEMEISKKFKVSRMTVRQATNELKREGYIHSAQGKGMFVSSGTIKLTLNKLNSFTEEIKSLGYKPGVKLISTEFETADGERANDLKINAGDKVFKVLRLRFIDNKVFSLNKSFFPINIYPSIAKFNFNKMSIYKLIEEETKMKILWAEQILNVTAATPEESKFLEIEEGGPLLFLKRITYIINNTPIETAEVVFRPDRYSFKIKLSK